MMGKRIHNGRKSGVDIKLLSMEWENLPFFQIKGNIRVFFLKKKSSFLCFYLFNLVFSHIVSIKG